MVVYIFTVSQQRSKLCDTNITEMKKFTPPGYGESIFSDPGDQIHKWVVEVVEIRPRYCLVYHDYVIRVIKINSLWLLW